MKTIDVMVGDGWTSKPGHAWLFQYRRGINFRVVGERDHWVPSEVYRHTEEQDIPGHLAEELLKAWGYTITHGEGEKPAAKPEAKPADVPVVDAVWVEDTMADGSKTLTAYSGRESAESCAKLDMERGRARIVRIRNVDEEARESAADARQNDHNVSDRVDELVERVRALEKPTQTGVVKVPGSPVYGDGDWRRGVEWEAKRWREALTAAGVEYKESKDE